MCVIASAVGADPAVPGVSVGKVRLGDTRANVIKKLGKPSKSTQWRSGPFQDTWLGPKPPNDKYGSPVSERIFLHVIYRNSKVVQVEFNSPKFVTPAGISMRSSLAQFRAKYKNPRVRAYTYDDPGGGGYVGYYYDDVKSGIAFTFGVQDNFDARITPEALRIHLRGIPVLPNPGGKPTKANDEIPVGPAEQ
jgi:hypothetical protein